MVARSVDHKRRVAAGRYPKLIVTHFGLGYRWIAGDNDDSG